MCVWGNWQQSKLLLVGLWVGGRSERRGTKRIFAGKNKMKARGTVREKGKNSIQLAVIRSSAAPPPPDNTSIDHRPENSGKSGGGKRAAAGRR